MASGPQEVRAEAGATASGVHGSTHFLAPLATEPQTQNCWAAMQKRMLVLGGSWNLVTACSWAQNPTCSLPDWPYVGYLHTKSSSDYWLVTKSLEPASS